MHTTAVMLTDAMTRVVGKGSWYGTVSGVGEIEGSNVGVGVNVGSKEGRGWGDFLE